MASKNKNKLLNNNDIRKKRRLTIADGNANKMKIKYPIMMKLVIF